MGSETDNLFSMAHSNQQPTFALSSSSSSVLPVSPKPAASYLSDDSMSTSCDEEFSTQQFLISEPKQCGFVLSDGSVEVLDDTTLLGGHNHDVVVSPLSSYDTKSILVPISTTTVQRNDEIQTTKSVNRRSSLFKRRSSTTLEREKQERINLLDQSGASREADGTTNRQTIIRNICRAPITQRLGAVLIAFALLRRLWVLDGIPLVLIFHMVKIVLSWISFVAGAKEIREFVGLAQWWIRFGLDFSTKTVEGETVHRIITAYSLNFWNMFGKNYLFNTLKEITNESRTRVLKEARDDMNRARMATLDFGTFAGNIARQARNVGRNQSTDSFS